MKKDVCVLIAGIMIGYYSAEFEYFVFRRQILT